MLSFADTHQWWQVFCQEICYFYWCPLLQVPLSFFKHEKENSASRSSGFPVAQNIREEGAIPRERFGKKRENAVSYSCLSQHLVKSSHRGIGKSYSPLLFPSECYPLILIQ